MVGSVEPIMRSPQSIRSWLSSGGTPRMRHSTWIGSGAAMCSMKSNSPQRQGFVEDRAGQLA